MEEKWRKILQKLKLPTGWLLALTYTLTVLFCGMAIALAIINPGDVVLKIVSYVSYAGAAITLSYAVYSIVIYAPYVKGNVISFIKKFKLGEKLLQEYNFRTVVFASLSLLVNIAYVVFHVVLALTTDTFFWYISLALYYGLLVLLRGTLVLYHKKGTDNKIEEIKKYRNCGVLLTLIPLCLLVPILQILFLNKAFVHEGLSIFAFAAYAFYKIIMAVYNLFRSKKETKLTVEGIRSIGLADALVSIFSLQTALLYAFSEGTDYSVFNVATGLAVFVLTIALGVMMLIKAKKQLEETKRE